MAIVCMSRSYILFVIQVKTECELEMYEIKIKNY